MHFVVARGSTLPAAALAEAARDVQGWPRWCSALRSVEEHEGELRLDFGGPRPMTIRVAVAHGDHGCSLALLDGDAAELSGHLAVAAGDSGSRVTLELELAFPMVLPGALIGELRDALGRWVEALIVRASGRRGPVPEGTSRSAG